YSTGAIYFAINDMPRDQRFLHINIICAVVLPGPKEPNVQQINHCLEPSTKELMLLQNGNLDRLYSVPNMQQPGITFRFKTCLHPCFILVFFIL
ncbi:hypothetical protein BD769DRAFT_1379862, partial [Suillus cothurnatus]